MKTDAIADKPRYFFKYRSITGDPDDEASNAHRTKDIIEKNQLFWPSPLSFNDPFNCLPAHQINGSKLKREFKLRKTIKTYYPQLSRAQVKAKARSSLSIPKNEQVGAMKGSNELWLKEIGICSLSATPSNVLMWSHYSDSHKGICVQFEPSYYWASSFSADNLYFEEALPVVYADKRPTFDLSNPMRDQKVLERQFLTKADYWNYEQEWRLLRSRERPGYQDFPASCLKSIILGAMISEANEGQVREWNAYREKPARIKRARLDKLTYELEIVSAEKD